MSSFTTYHVNQLKTPYICSECSESSGHGGQIYRLAYDSETLNDENVPSLERIELEKCQQRNVFYETSSSQATQNAPDKSKFSMISVPCKSNPNIIINQLSLAEEILQAEICSHYLKEESTESSDNEDDNHDKLDWNFDYEVDEISDDLIATEDQISFNAEQKVETCVDSKMSNVNRKRNKLLTSAINPLNTETRLIYHCPSSRACLCCSIS